MELRNCNTHSIEGRRRYNYCLKCNKLCTKVTLALGHLVIVVLWWWMNFNLWSLQGNLPLPTNLPLVFNCAAKRDCVSLALADSPLCHILSRGAVQRGTCLHWISLLFWLRKFNADEYANTILLKIPQIVHSIILHIARLLTLSKKSWSKKLLSGGEERKTEWWTYNPIY